MYLLVIPKPTAFQDCFSHCCCHSSRSTDVSPPHSMWLSSAKHLILASHTYIVCCEISFHSCYSGVTVCTSFLHKSLALLAAGHAISCATSFQIQGWRLSCPSHFRALSFLSFSSADMIISISKFSFHIHITFLFFFFFFWIVLIMNCLAKQILLEINFIINVLG